MESTEHDSNKISSEPRELNLVAWYGTIFGLIAMIILGSFFITRAYLVNHNENARNWRPAKIGRIEEDLRAINQKGEEVLLGQLADKVYVVGYQYTDCPGGCLGLAAVMKELLEKYPNNPNLHMVSISVNPESDTPEKMAAWLEDRGVTDPRWWFLTGDQKIITKFMHSQFKIAATQENTDPAKIATEGQWAHDQRLFLVDGDANIRGYFGVLHTEGGPTATKLLHLSVDMVLDPKKTIQDYQLDPDIEQVIIK